MCGCAVGGLGAVIDSALTQTDVVASLGQMLQSTPAGAGG